MFAGQQTWLEHHMSWEDLSTDMTVEFRHDCHSGCPHPQHNKSIICSCVAGHFSANCSQKALAFAKLWLMASNVRGVTGVTGVTLGRGWSWPAGT
jgi:hypothetical protein